jgi:hypothetical protein
VIGIHFAIKQIHAIDLHRVHDRVDFGFIAAF